MRVEASGWKKHSMNILFLYNGPVEPVKGGIERVTAVLASYFETKGHRIYFLGLKRSDSSKDNRQYYLPDSSAVNKKANARHFRLFLKEKNIDIVINQGGLDPKCSELAYHCRDMYIILISVIHNSLLASIENFSSAYAGRFQKLKLKWLLPLTDYLWVKNILLCLYWLKYEKHYKTLCKKSNKVILLSEKFKKELDFFTGNRLQKNVIGISNPVSFSPAIGDNNPQSRKKELLYVGRIDFSQKRVDLLLIIWGNLYRQFPGWLLRIVGGGEQLPEAMRLSSQLGLENVYFEGFQDPRKYYKNASLFCMTSSYEGFGIVLVEAMQYGVVPLAFNSYLSVTDIIDDQINGILISPFDTAMYVSCLTQLMENETLREEYSREAVKKSKEFSIEKIGGIWCSLFNDLKNDHAGLIMDM
jgi:glycosyltransferase involved in cell wall biosynthesis